MFSKFKIFAGQQQSNTKDGLTRRRTFKSKTKQLLSVFLLVITFSIFFVLPNFIHFGYGLSNKDMDPEIVIVVEFTYPISLICDFLIYTLSLKPIQKTMKKFFRCKNPRP